MTTDAFSELAPLFALGTLDAAEREAFQAHAASCAACRLEALSFEDVANQIPLALSETMPSPGLRSRIAASAQRLREPAAPRRSWTWTLPLAACLAIGIVSLVERARTRDARNEARALGRELSDARRRLADLEATAREDAAFRRVVSDPRARIANLEGLNDAASARARVVFRPQSREAILMVAGLARAPLGKSYQAWVISGQIPSPAGAFEVGDDGSVIFRLPDLDTTQAHTFAVTVEPQGGVSAPTGPMVLAGKAT